MSRGVCVRVCVMRVDALDLSLSSPRSYGLCVNHQQSAAHFALIKSLN